MSLIGLLCSIVVIGSMGIFFLYPAKSPNPIKSKPQVHTDINKE